jgi:hypothetical protein
VAADDLRERSAGDKRSRRDFHARSLLPAIVFLVVTGIVVGTFFALRGVVNSQERKLLV